MHIKKNSLEKDLKPSQLPYFEFQSEIKYPGINAFVTLFIILLSMKI